MNFNKNKLINKTLKQYYKTFACTLDTADYVPDKFNDKISKYIYKNMKAKFKEIEIFNLLYLQECGFKLGLIDKLKILCSGLKPLYLAEKNKKRSEVVKDKAESEQSERIKSERDLCSAIDNEASE